MATGDIQPNPITPTHKEFVAHWEGYYRFSAERPFNVIFEAKSGERGTFNVGDETLGVAGGWYDSLTDVDHFEEVGYMQVNGFLTMANMQERMPDYCGVDLFMEPGDRIWVIGLDGLALTTNNFSFLNKKRIDVWHWATHPGVEMVGEAE